MHFKVTQHIVIYVPVNYSVNMKKVYTYIEKHVVRKVILLQSHFLINLYLI